MSSEDWRVFRAVVLWGSIIGLVYTAMDSRNYAERGRSYQPPQLTDDESDNDSKHAGDSSRREW